LFEGTHQPWDILSPVLTIGVKCDKDFGALRQSVINSRFQGRPLTEVDRVCYDSRGHSCGYMSRRIG
jgi:hypothetical protein